MTKPSDNGGSVTRERVAVVTLAFHMETAALEIGGSCPTLEFTKAICQMAADELERLIQLRRMQKGIAVAGPELLEELKRQRGE